MFSGARNVYRRWPVEQPAPLWPRDTGDPAPVPLPRTTPRSFNLRNRHCRARCSFHSPPAGRFALRASAHWAHASLRCPFPRWGPAGPPSPNLGGSGHRPSLRHGLSFHRCAFPQQKATIIIVPVDGDHGVGSSYRPDNFQPVPMVCNLLSIERSDHPFPAAKIRQTQTGDVAECRQIPKPSFGAGKRTPDVTSPNHSQHHVIVRGRTENVANEGICRNERVALVFASFSLKKKKKSFPVKNRTYRQPKSQRTKKRIISPPAPSEQTSRAPKPKPLYNRFSFASFLLTQKKRRAPQPHPPTNKARGLPILVSLNAGCTSRSPLPG